MKYSNLTAAIDAALAGTETVNIIQLHESGWFKIVPENFILNRQYYHNENGRKQFFSYYVTIRKPKQTFPKENYELSLD